MHPVVAKEMFGLVWALGLIPLPRTTLEDFYEYRSLKYPTLFVELVIKNRSPS